MARWGVERWRAERGAGLVAYLSVPLEAGGPDSPAELGVMLGAERVEARGWGAGPLTSSPEPQNE